MAAMRCQLLLLLLLSGLTSCAPSRGSDHLGPAALGELARSLRGRVGAACALLEGGPGLALREAERFPMQSVYKLPIAMAVLAAVDRGALRLEARIAVTPADLIPPQGHSPLRDAHPQGAEVSLRELLRLAVAESDGSASDVLLRLLGGPAAVQAYLARLGVRGVEVADTEQAIVGDWAVQYRNSATPRGALELLRALHQRRGLSAPSQRLLLELMTVTRTGLRRLRAGLPPGASLAHKTGTSGMRAGITAATNDLGIVTLPDGRHLAIAVFVADSPEDEARREALIAELARAAVRLLAR